MTPDRRIRTLLLGWLLVPLALVLGASAVASYTTALRIASEAYDRALLDPALAIAQRLSAADGSVELDLSPAALEALRVDSIDRVYFAIGAHGRLIAGQAEVPAPAEDPVEGTPVFYDGTVRGEPVRVAAMTVPFADGPARILVAETLVKRERMVRQLLASSALPELAFFVVALAVVWYGVGRGLAPLEDLRAELAGRAPRDLRPLPADRAPLEVRPLVQALNDLLRRLAESIAAQQRFVADAAHQLRTPLAALQAQVDAARREPMPPELAAAIEHLHAAARRAAHLARQLLTLAAVEPAAERPFTPEPTDLAAVTQTRVVDWVARADTKAIDLGFELEPAPVAGEPGLLAELASNLVDNALHYTPRGGEVTLRTGRRNGCVFLEVEDNGPGIPAADRGQVLERFHRVKGTPGEGSGLGLAIVREIAHRHGAAVDIGAPASGSGTLVAVSFPVP
jgi:two-component system, OmpR family, sensor histidine kinase TctE